MPKKNETPKYVTSASRKKWLEQNFPKGIACDLCEKDFMAIMPMVFYLPLYKTAGAGVPSIMALCQTCGQIRQFSVEAAGLEIDETGGGSGAGPDDK